MKQTGVGSPDLPFRAVGLWAGPLASLSPVPHFLDQGAQTYSGGHCIRCSQLAVEGLPPFCLCNVPTEEASDEVWAREQAGGGAEV